MPNTGIVASSVVVGGTVVLDDPLENLTNWTFGGGTTTVAGRNGNGMQITGSNAANTVPPSGQSVDWTVTFSWRTTSLAARRSIGVFVAAGINQVGLRAETNGALSLSLGTITGSAIATSAATGLVAVNTWYTLEISSHIADAPNGIAIVKVNGTTAISFTGDTNNGVGAVPFDQITLFGGGSGAIATFDDFTIVRTS